ncbi:MAG: diguanylate cyclase, partial [Gammaproteobacteria bacterium]
EREKVLAELESQGSAVQEEARNKLEEERARIEAMRQEQEAKIAAMQEQLQGQMQDLLSAREQFQQQQDNLETQKSATPGQSNDGAELILAQLKKGGSDYLEPLKATGDTVFLELLQEKLDQVSLSGEKFACLMIEIDHYDKLQKHYDESAIDEVFASLEEIVNENLGGNDPSVTRYGEKHFAVIFGESSGSHPKELAETIRSGLYEMEIDISMQDVFLSCSIGIGYYPDDGETINDLLGGAWKSCRHAASSGGNRIVSREYT